MNGVNKTLYIPLYGKSEVSKKNIILKDPTAEHIWEQEGFPLKGKSKSKWLAYYMGMRARVFDEWLHGMMQKYPEAVVLHIGCGMDSRIHRVGGNALWYDIDFEEVINERKKYYEETDTYRMIASDARDTSYLANMPTKQGIVVLEGISMYLKPEELEKMTADLAVHFDKIHILMDCYTTKAAKASQHKNPINDVGVTLVYGLDEPTRLSEAVRNTNDRLASFQFVKEHNMTPDEIVKELKGMEKAIFKSVFAGKLSKSLYRMYEFEK
ncbi:MAG: class I SAM-dependent methyltransferase [Lachnospiraceae bacterium]|nr:class I SAM-dependent methyltransferase [Lachnospiraceae bacterium]